jgi:hypothetical protein
VSPKTRQTSTPTPTWKIAWACFLIIAAFIRSHVRATIAAVAGVVVVLVAVVHWATPVYHFIVDPNTRRDAAISANAAAISAATRDIADTRIDIVHRAATSDAQFADVTIKLEKVASSEAEASKNLAVSNAKLEALSGRLNDTNANLQALHDDLRAFLSRQNREADAVIIPHDFAASTTKTLSAPSRIGSNQ